jgi:hypothetical protein
LETSKYGRDGLFGGGCHGNNGLDPDTLIHQFKKYITPVLLYGMNIFFTMQNKMVFIFNNF